MAIFKFDLKQLWEKICDWSIVAGRSATRPVLLMWYVLKDPKTPLKDKWAIVAALAYLVLPIDVLEAKRFPIIGWIDEVVSFAVLIQKMTRYITPEMEIRADAQLDKWFGPLYEDVIIAEA